MQSKSAKSVSSDNSIAKVRDLNDRVDTDMSTFGGGCEINIQRQPSAEGFWEDPMETRPMTFTISNFVNKDKNHTVSIQEYSKKTRNHSKNTTFGIVWDTL